MAVTGGSFRYHRLESLCLIEFYFVKLSRILSLLAIAFQVISPCFTSRESHFSRKTHFKQQNILPIEISVVLAPVRIHLANGANIALRRRMSELVNKLTLRSICARSPLITEKTSGISQTKLRNEFSNLHCRKIFYIMKVFLAIFINKTSGLF